MGKYEIIYKDLTNNKQESYGWCLNKETAQRFKVDIKKEVIRKRESKGLPVDSKSFRIVIKKHKTKGVK